MDEQLMSHLREIEGQTFGALLAQVRVEKGMSQGELHRASGVSRPYITQIENGKRTPSTETALRLGAALDLAPAAVAFMTGDITATDLLRMQQITGTMNLIRSRLSDDEWKQLETLFGNAQEMLTWMDRISEIAAADDARPEPIPGWASLTKDDRKLIRALVQRLADRESQ